MTTATAQIRADIRGNRLQQVLALWYLVFWILTGISPVDRRDWLLENFLVVVFSGLLIATYDLGWKAVENPVHIHDLHATVLHQLGLDHTKLTFL